MLVTAIQRQKPNKNMPEKSSISFKSYLGADQYGSPKLRESLTYRVQLTPEKIDAIMKNAQTTDEGLVTVYKELVGESKHVDQGFMAFNFINRQYMTVAKRRIQGLVDSYIKKEDGKPIGNTKHLSSRVTGGKGKLEDHLKNLLSDFDDINEKYVENGLKPLIIAYAKISQYFQEGIDYVNMRKSSSPLREKLLDNTKKMLEKYESPYEKIFTRLDKQGDSLVNNSNTVLESYSKLTGRSVQKIIKWVGRISRVAGGG